MQGDIYSDRTVGQFTSRSRNSPLPCEFAGLSMNLPIEVASVILSGARETSILS